MIKHKCLCLCICLISCIHIICDSICLIYKLSKLAVKIFKFVALTVYCMTKLYHIVSVVTVICLLT